MSQNQTPKDKDTLQETFELFFGPTENTGGTGRVIRQVAGELHSVLVDADEAAKFQAERQAEIEKRLEHERKLDELMQALNR